MTTKQMVGEIREEMNASLVSPRRWYVGVSRNARASLFESHRVRENGDRWIYLPACSAADADNVLSYFQKSWFWRADVAPLNGAGDAVEIYAFLKEAHTNPGTALDMPNHVCAMSLDQIGRRVA